MTYDLIPQDIAHLQIMYSMDPPKQKEHFTETRMGSENQAGEIDSMNSRAHGIILHLDVGNPRSVALVRP